MVYSCLLLAVSYQSLTQSNSINLNYALSSTQLRLIFVYMGSSQEPAPPLLTHDSNNRIREFMELPLVAQSW